MPDVFISYSQEDKAQADNRGIEWVIKDKAPELSVWRDDRIQGGTHWGDTIKTNLRAAKCVVVIWSKNSWQSPWVNTKRFTVMSATS